MEKETRPVQTSQPQQPEPQPLSNMDFCQDQAHAGSLDGHGAGDHDQPYRAGWRPRSSVPYPFNTRQYSRLLVLRSRVQDGLLGADDIAA
jgi:hypothetical protein